MAQKAGLPLLFVSVAASLVVAGCGGGGSHTPVTLTQTAGATGVKGSTSVTGPTGSVGATGSTSAIGPVAESKNQLMNRALAVGGPIYWIGPKKGFHYEFQRLTNHNIYVRYLPKGVEAGGKPGKLLIVATYPMTNAYARLQKGGASGVVAGKNGSIVWVRTGDPNSVYVAWPHVPYEIEVYDPSPSEAARVAKSGQIQFC